MQDEAPSGRRIGRAGGHGKALVAIGCIAIAMLAGFAVWHLWQPPVMGRARLSDGTPVILRGVTFGTRHKFAVAGPLPMWLHSIGIPLSLEPERIHYPTPRSVVWFDVGLPAAKALPPLFLGPPVAVSAELRDTHGCLLPARYTYVESGGGGPFSGLQHIELPPHAPRGSRCILRCYERAGESETRLFEFLLPKSAPKAPARAPGAAVRPLPQTVVTSRVRATLRRIDYRDKGSVDYAVAGIDAGDKDKPALRWTPISVVAEDPRGWVGRDGYWRFAMGATATASTFHPMCRQDSFWKLAASLAPEPWNGRPPDHRWRYRLPVGTTVNWRPKPAGWSGGLYLVIQQDGISYGTGTHGRDLGLVQMQVQLERAKHDERIVVSKINGESLPKLIRRLAADQVFGGDFGYADLTPGNNWYSQIMLPNPWGLKPMDLEFVGYRAEKVEFVVKP